MGENQGRHREGEPALCAALLREQHSPLSLLVERAALLRSAH